MWECYYLTNFAADGDSPHLPQHTEEGGAYQVVGDRLRISPKTVLYHTTNAKKRLDTVKGVREFQDWLTKYKANGLHYILFPAHHPSSIAERERREAAGVGRRKLRKIGVSGKIGLK